MNIRKEYNKKQELLQKYKDIGYDVSNLGEYGRKNKQLEQEYKNMSKLQENLVVKTAIEKPELIENTNKLAKSSGVPKEVVEETLRKTNFNEIMEEQGIGQAQLAESFSKLVQKVNDGLQTGDVGIRDGVNAFTLWAKLVGADRQQIDVSLEEKGKVFDIINDIIE